MMTREDLESYLLRLGLEYEEVEDGMWLLRSEDGPGIVVQLSPPVLLMRLKMLEIPGPSDEPRVLPLYRRLLELNASDIVHGSYGLDGDDIILSDALDFDRLDFDGLRGSYESMLYTATSHMAELAELVMAAHEG
jgi:hypothetical protein